MRLRLGLRTRLLDSSLLTGLLLRLWGQRSWLRKRLLGLRLANSLSRLRSTHNLPDYWRGLWGNARGFSCRLRTGLWWWRRHEALGLRGIRLTTEELECC